MAFRLPSIIRRASLSSKAADVPKGYLAVYVGEEMKRFLIPVSYLNQPSFQELLNHAEEQLGHPLDDHIQTLPQLDSTSLEIMVGSSMIFGSQIACVLSSSYRCP